MNADGYFSHEVQRHLLPGRKAMTNLDSILFANKGLSSQSYGFSRSHVWMWELDYKESWAMKNWCFCTVVLEKILESPLDCKEIQPVHPKGNQSWIFIGRADAEAETPILWPPDAKNWLMEKELATHSSVLAWRIPGTGCLVGYHLWGRTDSDMTDVT